MTSSAPTASISGEKQHLMRLFESAAHLDNVDVHKFNRQWAKPNLPTIEEVFVRHYGEEFGAFYELLGFNELR